MRSRESVEWGGNSLWAHHGERPHTRASSLLKNIDKSCFRATSCQILLEPHSNVWAECAFCLMFTSWRDFQAGLRWWESVDLAWMCDWTTRSPAALHCTRNWQTATLIHTETGTICNPSLLLSCTHTHSDVFSCFNFHKSQSLSGDS